MATIRPTTLGELQLYKVLQRSNLLSYYPSFISQGGDDVQQLCEAGEEEFLEIMALVEMASKPLHVRRLQKALQEWVTRPAIFQNIGINYLPSQSIPLTALGIDASELIQPSHSPSATHCFSYGRDTGSAPPQNGGASSRSQIPNSYMNGGQNRIANGKESHASIRNDGFAKNKGNGRSIRSPSTNHDIENSDANGIMNILQSVVQRLVTPSKNQDNNEVMLKLKADGRHSDLVSALEGQDDSRTEMEIQHFVKTHKTADGTAMSRHEILLNEAAVKLAMEDKRYLINKNELMSLAEKVVLEVESRLPTTRQRSSSHLHGSTCQNRMQEVNNQIWEIRAKRQNLHKRLSEVKASKNVIKENEYQSRLERCTQDEVLLLKERNELLGRLKGKSGESPTSTSSKKTSFSSDLADLAKAHNLSFGNLQSSEIVTPTAPWEEGTPGSSIYKETSKVSNSPSCSSGLSPPQLEDIDKLPDADISPASYLVKAESNEDSRYPITPRTGKRKHTVEGSQEERNAKSQKSFSSSDVSSE